MKAFDDLALFVTFSSPLMRPSHAFTSLNQLARRSRIGDDKLRRTLTRLEQAVNDPLIRPEGRRLVLTGIGRDLLVQSERLLAVGKNRAEPDPVETMSVAIAEGIGPQVLARPSAEFLAEWRELVALRFPVLDPETIREHIAAGTVSFGIGWEDDGADSAVVRLEPGAAWSVLAHPDHPLVRASKTLTASLLAEVPVFLPPQAARSRHLHPLLSGLLPANRVEVDSPSTARACAATGAGVAFDLEFPGEDFQTECVRLPVEVPEREWLVLYLPRSATDMSEPARFMVEAVKRGMLASRKSRPVREKKAEETEPAEATEALPV